jgi:hypothetical protein
MLYNGFDVHSGPRRDRRRARRYSFFAGIELDWGSTVLHGTAREISANSLFIEISEWPCVYGRFSARLTLDTPLPLECLLQRVVPRQGFAVTISVPDREAKQRFDALLLALEKEEATAVSELSDAGFAAISFTQPIFPFKRSSILSNVPRVSGVYAIRGSKGWIYVGESEDIQTRLLKHLGGDNTCVTKNQPLAFQYELVAENQRMKRQADLILKLRPICNQRLGNRLRTPPS